MRRQRNTAQMKEQNNMPKKELNKMERANLPEAEFKTLVIRMLKEITGYCNSIKKTQEEIKVTLSEIKKNLQPGLVWLVDRAPACEPKGCWFNSQSGHTPGLQARSLVGGLREATTH